MLVAGCRLLVAYWFAGSLGAGLLVAGLLTAYWFSLVPVACTLSLVACTLCLVPCRFLFLFLFLNHIMLKIAFDQIFAYPLPEGHRFPMLKYELIPEQLMYEGIITMENIF